MSHTDTEEEKNAAFAEEPECCRDGKIIRLDERQLREHLDRQITASVEETLNKLLDAEGRDGSTSRHDAWRDRAGRGDAEGEQVVTRLHGLDRRQAGWCRAGCR